MGELAEAMINGDDCAGCGVPFDEEGDGFPRYCDDCDDETASKHKSKRPAVKIPAPLKTHEACCQSIIDRALDGVEKNMGGKLSKKSRKGAINALNEFLSGFLIVDGIIVHKVFEA